MTTFADLDHGAGRCRVQGHDQEVDVVPGHIPGRIPDQGPDHGGAGEY